MVRTSVFDLAAHTFHQVTTGLLVAFLLCCCIAGRLCSIVVGAVRHHGDFNVSFGSWFGGHHVCPLMGGWWEKAGQSPAVASNARVRMREE